MSDLPPFEGDIIDEVDECGDSIIFTMRSGRQYELFHSQDCCESVTIQGRDGEWASIKGKLVSKVSLQEYSGFDLRPSADSATKTEITFVADENTVVSRWIGTSNGYYSERVHWRELGAID